MNFNDSVIPFRKIHEIHERNMKRLNLNRHEDLKYKQAGISSI